MDHGLPHLHAPPWSHTHGEKLHWPLGPAPVQAVGHTPVAWNEHPVAHPAVLDSCFRVAPGVTHSHGSPSSPTFWASGTQLVAGCFGGETWGDGAFLHSTQGVGGINSATGTFNAGYAFSRRQSWQSCWDTWAYRFAVCRKYLLAQGQVAPALRCDPADISRCWFHPQSDQCSQQQVR